MGKFTDNILRLLENVAGPLDWQREYDGSCESFSGRFLVYDRWGSIRMSVHGRIVLRGASTTDVYLYDPPQFVSSHKHGSCLQLLTPHDRWFKLHFEKPAANFTEAYTYVEHLLTEAYNFTPLKLP
jgi:hypothetical protein